MNWSVALEYGFKTIKPPLPLKQVVSDQNKLITDASKAVAYAGLALLSVDKAASRCM